MSIYILGTGLSHDGSSCLVKDDNIIITVEKDALVIDNIIIRKSGL